MKRLPLTRRQMLSGLSASLLLPAGLRVPVVSADPGNPFRHGVASGDPENNSVVLWTRLTTTIQPAECRWELAQTPDFDSILRSGTVATGPHRDYTVKVVVSDLAPGALYYYRFHFNQHSSPTGRTRTLASGALDALGLAVASCSNLPFGYFNAYEAIARDDSIDFVLHLGDYLYEYGPDGYGGGIGAQLGRPHVPPREMVSLEDYRLRHAQYKADSQSQVMHAAHPLIPLWDDHESTNNPWRDGAENHQPATEGRWDRRRQVSLQAWYEWMPVRDPGPDDDPAAYWRHFRFGNLASLVTLETRHTGRSQQVDYDIETLGEMTPAAAERFLSEIVGVPGRDMLSAEMQAFAAGALAESVAAGRPWRLIGNQIPMARMASPRLSDSDMAYLEARVSSDSLQRARYFQRLGELGLPLYLDPWDGYPRAREAFYQSCRYAGASDLVVLTGDSHSFWQNTLHNDEGHPMGVELGTTGITSPGDFLEFGTEGARLMDSRLITSNPEVQWTDGISNGYLRVRVTEEQLRADFVGVDNILSRDYRTQTLRSVAVIHDGPYLHYAVPAEG